jgi:hypothetical protein
MRCDAMRCDALRCWILLPAARLHILITCTSANIGRLYLRVNAAVRGVSHTAFRQRMPWPWPLSHFSRLRAHQLQWRCIKRSYNFLVDRDSPAPSGTTAAVELHQGRRHNRPMVALTDAHRLLQVRDEVSSFVLCVCVCVCV